MGRSTIPRTVTEDRIRVLQVVGNLERGGGQEVVRTLVGHLAEAGADAVVVSLADGPLRRDIEAAGTRVVVIRERTTSLVDGWRGIREIMRIREDLAAVAREHEARVVQTHLLRSLDFVALTLRSSRDVDVVLWTVHNALLDLRPDQLPGNAWLLGPKRIAHRFMYRVGGRIADGFVAVSDDVGSSVRHAYRPPRSRLTVIPNGVEVERYGASIDRGVVRSSIGVPADAPMAIVVAKLMTQKGHVVLLDALHGVHEQFPQLRTVLVGEGELRGELEAQVQRERLGGQVVFLGDRADIPALLAASDVFVLPSLWEGLPMALLEAMASGLPVIASAVSGTRQVVEPGRSGVLVPPGDPDALSQAITRVLGDPAFAARLGAAARVRVEDCYSARAQAQRHVQLYRTRLSAREGGRM